MLPKEIDLDFFVHIRGTAEKEGSDHQVCRVVLKVRTYALVLELRGSRDSISLPPTAGQLIQPRSGSSQVCLPGVLCRPASTPDPKLSFGVYETSEVPSVRCNDLMNFSSDTAARPGSGWYRNTASSFR